MSKKPTNLYGIIGLGRFGFALAQSLAEAGSDILVVDCNEDKIKQATEFTDNAFLVQNISKETLQEVGIKNCDTVIVCIGEKIDTCILATMILINLGIKRVIAKAISFELGCVLERIGAEVVYPERDMAVRLANKLLVSTVIEYISLSDQIDIAEIKLSNSIEGMSVEQIDLRKKYGLNIIAVKQNGEITIDIEPKLKLSSNDDIVVVGKRTNIKVFEQYLRE